MTNNEYGTVAFYSEHFADILADVATYGTAKENEQTVKNIIRGFQVAIQDWIDYHSAAVASYSQLRNELIAEDREERALLEELEAETLPEIPDFPSVLK